MSITTIGISLNSLPSVKKRLREDIQFSSSSLSNDAPPPLKRRRKTRYVKFQNDDDDDEDDDDNDRSISPLNSWFLSDGPPNFAKYSSASINEDDVTIEDNSQSLEDLWSDVRNEKSNVLTFSKAILDSIGEGT